jgi:hypothetical protein
MLQDSPRLAQSRAVADESSSSSGGNDLKAMLLAIRALGTEGALKGLLDSLHEG